MEDRLRVTLTLALSENLGERLRGLDLAVDLFCDNLRRYLAGEPLRNVVNAQRGY